jgi:hypothetical protein
MGFHQIKKFQYAKGNNYHNQEIVHRILYLMNAGKDAGENWPLYTVGGSIN